MGVVKTASESILEETVVPSEEANYSLQGHAGKSEKGRKNVEECVRMRACAVYFFVILCAGN